MANCDSHGLPLSTAREVIEDMLLLALMRGREVAKAWALLDRRLHRRASSRDARWLARLTA